MGSGESSTRRVSFGVDDEDRVRILRGVKLSEEVLQRMRGVANIAPERQKDAGSSSPRPQERPRTQPGPKSSPKPSSYAKEEQRRFERQQKVLKEELAKVAQRERDAARDEAMKAMTREREQKRLEAENAKQLSSDEITVMAQELHKKDLQLTALDAFYKEQLAQLEKRNLERYEQSKDEFHQAASKTEESVRSRNTDPVCVGLQTQILSCYRDNREQTLRCSDLAKQYLQCINAAKKNLLVNHG